MNWIYINSGFNTGRYNMDFDLRLAKIFREGEAILRLYRWKPYCISLGANQPLTSVDSELSANDNIDIVGLQEFAPGKQLTIVLNHPDGKKEYISANHSYNEIQISWFKAGSALNLIRKANMEST